MNVLVTGGCGFVGTNLIKRLLEDNHGVFSLDNYKTGSEDNHQDGCVYIDGDIRISNGYDICNPDVVFHMAAIARIQPSFDDPVDYFTTNAGGTLNLIDWCSKAEVPLIYAGTSSKHSGKFKNPYTFSKGVGEDLIKLYQLHFGLRASTARFYNVYGAHQLLEGEYTTLIGKWVNAIEGGEECYVYGDGEQRRDFTHVDDIVDALVLIMEKEAYGYEFELGRGKNYSVNEVAEMLGVAPEYLDGRKGEARNTLNVDNKAAEILGWVPERDLEDYVEEWRASST